MINELSEQRRLAGISEGTMADETEKAANLLVDKVLNQVAATMKKAMPKAAKALAKEMGISEKEALSWIAREFNTVKSRSLWTGAGDLGRVSVDATFISGLA